MLTTPPIPKLSIPSSGSPSYINNVYPVPATQAAKCLYYQQILGSPTKHAMVNAALHGLFKNLFPQLTTEFIRAHYVLTDATGKAYLQRRRRKPSSKSITPPTPPPRPEPPSADQHLPGLHLRLISPRDMATEYSDVAHPHPGSSTYYLILYAYDPNFIQSIQLPGPPTSRSLIEAYTSAWTVLSKSNPKHSYLPQLEVTDNVISSLLGAFFDEQQVALTLVSTNDHRANKAERAIQTWKKALIAALNTAHPELPLAALPHIVNHLNVTINLLRPSRINPTISAYEQLHGPLDLKRHPLAPIGAKGLVYEPAEIRQLGTYGDHGVVGFYVGLAPRNYDSYTMYIPHTNRTRVTDSIYWLPFNPNYPLFFPTQTNPYTDTRDPPPLSHRRRVHFSPPPTIAPLNPEGAPAIPEGAPPTHSLPIGPEGAPLPPPPLSLPPSPVSVINPPSPNPIPQSNNRTQCPAPTNLALFTHYLSTIKGPNLKDWHDSMDREIAKLYTTFNGIKVITASEVPPNKRSCPFLNPVTREKRDPVTNALIDRRTRLTWGIQPRPDDPHLNSSSVISSQAVKIMLNAAVSENHAILSSIDLNYFYYQSKIPTDYCRLLVRYIPPASRQLLGIPHLRDTDTVYLAVTIAIPGRPDAGKIAQQALLSHLQQAGYTPATHTDCLFTNPTNSVQFVTHVDDFLIKSDGRTDDVQHLVNHLSTKYTLNFNRTATSYLGAKISLSRNSNPHLHSVTVSMPHYVQAGLDVLSFTPTYHPNSPEQYQAPTYSNADTIEVTDDSPPASPAQQSFLRKAVGIFRYYVDAVDFVLIKPMALLAKEQSKPTQATMERLDRFLNYIAQNQQAVLSYRPSNMQLVIHSDASHHGEPAAQSRAGGYFVLGNPSFTGPGKPHSINSPITVISKRLPTVTSSTAESEYGALFINAQAACPLRLTLHDFGYPQSATPIIYDNEVAGKVAKAVAKQKKSKAFATRYHWIQDRVRLKEFTLHWKPGTHNLADFFTKTHPVHHFKTMRSIYLPQNPTPIASSLPKYRPKSPTATTQ